MSFSKNPQLDMVVVMDVTAEGAKPARPTPDQPAYYVAFDGGYQEAGDPIGNQNPPAATEMARALRQTLATAGYRPATDQTSPSLLLIYHWGALNRDSMAIRSGMDLNPNQKARVALVAGKRYERQIDEELAQRQMSREMHTSFPPPALLTEQAQELRELAQGNRYFVIVSAFDYAAARRHEARLLWRTKMSASDAGVAMATALPALIQGGGPYFGRDADEPQYVRAPVGSGSNIQSGSPAGAQAPEATSAVGQLDAPYVRDLAAKDTTDVTGERPRSH